MKGISHQSRLDETFRLTAIGNNIAMERERQRALLSEWEKSIFASFYLNERPQLQWISKSEFGVWFTHKASLILEQVAGLNDVITCMQKIDEDILPKLQSTALQDYAAITEQLGLIDQQLVKIRFVMKESFESHLEFENAKDVLTKLLNRRFMHTVLSREINLQRRSDAIGFALLLLDLDYFKRVNDQYGHEAGDMVLQRSAAIITSSVRPSDFIFRYGGEEILIVLVEVAPSKVIEIADKIRKNIEQHQFQLPNGEHISMTVSIGGVHAKGKYDYQGVINEADQALYHAKTRGRNNVYMLEN
jgi:diguanylate cyclase